MGPVKRFGWATFRAACRPDRRSDGMRNQSCVNWILRRAAYNPRVMRCELPRWRPADSLHHYSGATPPRHCLTACCSLLRCLAAETWQQHFSADPLNREAGDHLRQNLLQLGGARTPRDLVRGLLGERALIANGAGGCMPVPNSYLAEIQALRSQ